MRILSGVQPSGELHLGNYFGAIQQHLELQTQGEALYFIADFHALTTVQDAAKLRELVRDVAATYLALGLDPTQATFFRQSDVPEVHELTWMLECVTGMGELERATSYKDKVANGITPSVGLFTYPALMASDILIYRSNLVPVGKDQVQHVEICRDMAGRFNHAFSTDVLIKPESRLSKTPKVPGTDGQKMSKSYGNTIPIFASGKKLKKAINAIVTDSKDPSKEPLDPDTCNAFAIFELFADEAEREGMATRYREDRTLPGYGTIKQRIRELMDEKFGPARERKAELLKPGSELDDVLEAGGKKARAIARETLDICREATGLTDPRGYRA
ncbi:MAG: tryptophan--tRNA ligase [Planctomycetes bacterium]|nr:tryptophan--tRNA ligase [Planctomycetota bacterium]